MTAPLIPARGRSRAAFVFAVAGTAPPDAATR
jgi:hypothetical protein